MSNSVIASIVERIACGAWRRVWTNVALVVVALLIVVFGWSRVRDAMIGPLAITPGEIARESATGELTDRYVVVTAESVESTGLPVYRPRHGGRTVVGEYVLLADGAGDLITAAHRGGVRGTRLRGVLRRPTPVWGQDIVAEVNRPDGNGELPVPSLVLQTRDRPPGGGWALAGL